MNSSPYVDSTCSGIIEIGIVKFLVPGCVGSERIPIDVVGPRGVFDDSSLLVCVGNERRHCFTFALIVACSANNLSKLKSLTPTVNLVSVVVKDKFDAPINDVDLSSAKPLSKLLRKRVLKERI